MSRFHLSSYSHGNVNNSREERWSAKFSIPLASIKTFRTGDSTRFVHASRQVEYAVREYVPCELIVGLHPARMEMGRWAWFDGIDTYSSTGIRPVLIRLNIFVQRASLYDNMVLVSLIG